MLCARAAAGGLGAGTEGGAGIAEADVLLERVGRRGGGDHGARAAVKGAGVGTVDHDLAVGALQVVVAVIGVAHGGAGDVLSAVAVPVAVGGEQGEIALAGGLHRVVGERDAVGEAGVELAGENPAGARQGLAQGRALVDHLLVKLVIPVAGLGDIEVVDLEVVLRLHTAALAGALRRIKRFDVDETHAHLVRDGHRCCARIGHKGQEGAPGGRFHHLDARAVKGVPARVVLDLLGIGAGRRGGAIGAVGPVGVAGGGRLDDLAVIPAVAWPAVDRRDIARGNELVAAARYAG